jgi:SAM-dependent methyltransferase
VEDSEVTEEERYLQEYSTSESVQKYVSETAGDGIEYLLESRYIPMYLEQIADLKHHPSASSGFRIVEFGCGGGMNLIHLVNRMAELHIPIDVAYGSDFAEPMIWAAQDEARRHLDPSLTDRVRFFQTPNETLHDGLAQALGVPKQSIAGSFHLILGINTFRYCWRLGKSEDCARDIFNLLVNGGRVVIVDMNDRHPYQLADLRHLLKRRPTSGDGDFATRREYIRRVFRANKGLPALKDYSGPFRTAGFEILEEGYFCWIPHSARRWRLQFWRTLSPILDKLAKTRAMRSKVIARRPEDSGC